jgi:hypothetical protein
MASLTTSDFSSEEAICKEVAITILNNHYNAQRFLTWKAREDVGRIGSLYNRTFTVMVKLQWFFQINRTCRSPMFFHIHISKHKFSLPFLLYFLIF